MCVDQVDRVARCYDGKLGRFKERCTAGRKSTNMDEKRLSLKISEDLYCHWAELKNLKNGNEVFGYLLDLARDLDQGLGPVTRYWCKKIYKTCST